MHPGKCANEEGISVSKLSFGPHDHVHSTLTSLLGHISYFVGFEKLPIGHKDPSNNIRQSQEDNIPLVHLHCPVPQHRYHSAAESELSLHRLSLLLAKVEWCPPTHESEEDTMESGGADTFIY